MDLDPSTTGLRHLPGRKGPRDCSDIELNYAQLTAKKVNPAEKRMGLEVIGHGGQRRLYGKGPLGMKPA